MSRSLPMRFKTNAYEGERDQRGPSIAAPPSYSEATSQTTSQTPPSPLSEADVSDHWASRSSTPPLSKPPLEPPRVPDGAYQSSQISTPRRPPPNAQRARPPLHISQKNSSIKGDFLILGGANIPKPDKGKDETPSARPHVSLFTTNASITGSIWVDDYAWDRPFAMNIDTTNAGIQLSIHTLHPRQPIELRSTTSNASHKILLPPDFHGLLTVKTSNNKHHLSPSLQERSIRVPSGPEEKNGATWYEIGGPGGRSKAWLWTSNARIDVGFVGDKEDVAAVESKCAVM